MAAIGGSIESIIIDGREFPVAADADVTLKLGGFENEVQPNGNGSDREIKKRVVGKVSGLVVEIDDARGDHEYLQERADSSGKHAIVLTKASGVVYQGDMKLTGELSASSMNATMGIELSGGTLSQQ